MISLTIDSGTSPKPRLRCYYWGERRPVVNLGDLLTPYLIDALGFSCVARDSDDSDIVNPGRCLIVIGSLLTRHDMELINYPLDVWGCGWKGPTTRPSGSEVVRFFAVRGPQTAMGLGLPTEIVLGDPALLFPRLVPLDVKPHGRTVLIPHCLRLTAMPASYRRKTTGCDMVLSPLVLRSFRDHHPSGFSLKEIFIPFIRLIRQGIYLRGFRDTLGLIAGAGFVLTGSLHGAILSQAYGIPWAAYDDGYVDAPSKWTDWAAYLGIDIELARNLRDGRDWWRRSGHKGRIRNLEDLINAFPYARPEDHTGNKS